MFTRTHPDRSGKKNQMHLRNFWRRAATPGRLPTKCASEKRNSLRKTDRVLARHPKGLFC
jgi:hypothetical protein